MVTRPATRSAKRGAGTDLAPRVEPVQARAKATVERLLATTAELLEEVGVDGFTTNLLAERADVRIRTVYRYFPNKLAVIVAVTERNAEQERQMLNRISPLGDPEVPLEEAIDRLWDGYMRGAGKIAGFVAIRRALQATPELREVENRVNVRLAEELAVALRRRGIELPRRQMTALARTFVESTAALLDFAHLDGRPQQRALIRELKRMSTAYLQSYLEPPPRRR